MSEVAIVGGGLAGGAAATLLARRGERVTLYEREAEPVDKVCGEFLSIEARRQLEAVGLDPHALGAVPIRRLRLVSGRRIVEARLPFEALGITRRRLDDALLDHAARAGARIERDVAVRAIRDGRAETVRGPIDATTLLLATGKHELRGAPRDTRGCDTGFVGFKSYWRVPARVRESLAGMIDVTLFAGGYAGLQLVEDGSANLCLLVRKDRFAAIGRDWPALLAALLEEPHLATLLGDAEPTGRKPLSIAAVPYGFRHRADPSETLYRLGDQAAVIPSFCGDGMAIALESARMAADAVSAGATAADYHARLRHRLGGQIRLAMALQRLGEAAWSRAALLAMLGIAPALATRLAGLTRVR